MPMIHRIARFLAIAALWIVLAAYILTSVVLSAVWSALPVLLAILLKRRKHAVIMEGERLALPIFFLESDGK